MYQQLFALKFLIGYPCACMQKKGFCQIFVLLGLEGLRTGIAGKGIDNIVKQYKKKMLISETVILLVLLQCRKYLSCGSEQDHSGLR